MRSALAASLVIVGVAPTLASVIHVPSNYPAIQVAIDLAQDGDTVLVAAGVYAEHINFKGKNIVVRSESGRDSTFLEPVVVQVPLVSFVSFEDTGAVFDGFTIRGVEDGDGIVCRQSSPVIRNCDISYCQELGRGGHGISSSSASPRILNNRFHHNAAAGTGWGAGVWLRLSRAGRDALIAGNDFYNNWGGAIFADDMNSLTVHHNLVRGNFGNNVTSVYVLSYGQSRVYNNTILDGYNGLQVWGGLETEIFNNIIAGQAGAGITLPAQVGYYYDYNNVWSNASGNEAGPNGLSVDPLFSNPGTGDFRLGVGSPCLDAGRPGDAYNDADGTRGDVGSGSVSGIPHEPFWLCPAGWPPGDVNGNRSVTSSDIILMVNYCFKSGPAPYPCAAKGDCDCNGFVTSGDLISLINYVFGGASTSAALKGGGDPPCNICRFIYGGLWACP